MVAKYRVLRYSGADLLDPVSLRYLLWDPEVESHSFEIGNVDEMVAECLALGGSISGEHGIGVLKQPYLETQVGTVERALMHRIKAAFDPTGILNPGRGI